MKDFLKQELNAGDLVVIMMPRYRDFLVAKVVAFTEKKVRVSYREPDGYGGEIMLWPTQLVKIKLD